ncbi:MAG: Na(+)-translocating NADH-quinone reductase subunit [Verrucomicrobiota bacterium]
MKFLEEIFHKAKPMFTKGGKYERLYPLYEAKESFLFVTDKKTDRGAHIRDSIDLKRMMITVVVAMLPCLFFGIWNVGQQAYEHGAVAAAAAKNLELHSQYLISSRDHLDCFLFGLKKVLPLLIVVYGVGGICEVIFSVVRKHEINEGFLVTGLLIVLTLPPTIPLWLAGVGTAFGVIIGKEIFGGTGMNILNPALTARAFLFFAYPVTMAGDKVWVAGPNGETLTCATPLGIAGANVNKAAEGVPLDVFSPASGLNVDIQTAFIGYLPGSIGETSTLCCLIGAAILIISGVGSWRVMLGCVAGLMGTAWLMTLHPLGQIDGTVFALGPVVHACIGGFALGAVFMATDPVSAASTNLGKWIYGILIGVLCMVIRCINPAYPEGMMLAILLMNVFSPLIDFYVVKASINRRLAHA